MDHYQLLGIRDTASKDEIKKAYRKLALTSHPDKNQSSNAAEQFRAFNEAYKILKDDHKRELYDRFELPALRASRIRSHDRFGAANEQRPRRTKYDEQFFTGSSEVFCEELRHKNELDRIRQSNSELLDAANAKYKNSSRSSRTKSANRSSSKRTTDGLFVGDILPNETDDDYEKIVLSRLRALGRN